MQKEEFGRKVYTTDTYIRNGVEFTREEMESTIREESLERIMHNVGRIANSLGKIASALEKKAESTHE